MRLFVAIALPDEVAAGLLTVQSGVPGARWSDREHLHLTLRFIGEVDGSRVAAIDDALCALSVPTFTLCLKGVGEFGGRKPRALWAGISPSRELLHLQRKIETALQRIGLPAEERKFTPHITLARLRATSPGQVADFLVDHALYASVPFPVSQFSLYSSHTAPTGSVYRIERDYALRG